MAVISEAIYVRQSKDKKDSLSIEGQIQLCKHECSNPETALIYVDKGFSGKNTLRPAFQSMLRDMRLGGIDKIIVYRLDRLSRSIIDFGQLWAELEKNEVAFASVNEKFDTSTPMGRAMIYIIMVFAQLERETIGERVTDNYYTRIQYGNWPGGPAPYGMINGKKVNGDGLTVPTLNYAKEFNIVEEIFSRYATEDISLGQLALDLTKRAIPCNKRAGWDNVALSRILHSPVYVKADKQIYIYYQSLGVKRFSNAFADFTGKYSAHVVGKRTGNVRKYTDYQEHVVSLTNFKGKIESDVWLACQEKLERNQQIGNSGKGKHTWLAGLLKCGKCGYSLSIRTWKERKYLYCSGRANLHICDKKTFRQKITDIEKEVQNELERMLNEGHQEELVMPSSDRSSKMTSEISTVELHIDRLIKGLAQATDITAKYLNKEIERLALRKKGLLKQYESFGHMEREMQHGILFTELEFEEKKVAVQALVEKVMIYEEDIEIVWNRKLQNN